MRRTLFIVLNQTSIVSCYGVLKGGGDMCLECDSGVLIMVCGRREM